MKRLSKEELVEMPPEEFEKFAGGVRCFGGDVVPFLFLAIGCPEVETATKAFLKRWKAKEKAKRKKARVKSQVATPPRPRRQNRKRSP